MYSSSTAQGIKALDSPSIDAFGRWRVSNPTTVFDSKNIHDDPDLASSVENQPLFYDNQETSGSGTSTTYNANESSQTLAVGATTEGTRVRQTKMRFNYQPGKSQLVFMTFNMKGNVSGITKREGIFDENNGFYLELDGTNVNLVRRTSTSGAPVNNSVSQSSWNKDRFDGTGESGVTLDFTKTQIMWIDYEWLGVGRVRLGFVVDGMFYQAHEFLNTNSLDVVYMKTPNLPLRSEISNDGTGVAATMEQICSTVISEGGSEDLGSVRRASTAGTHLDMAAENTIYAIIGIRLKSGYLDTAVKLIKASLQIQTASHQVEWYILLNPTVANSFTYSGLAQSAIEVATGGATNTVTGGYQIAGDFFESGGNAAGAAGSFSVALDSAIRLGSLIDGTVDEIVLCARPIGGSTAVDIEGGITWRELS